MKRVDAGESAVGACCGFFYTIFGAARREMLQQRLRMCAEVRQMPRRRRNPSRTFVAAALGLVAAIGCLAGPALQARVAARQPGVVTLTAGFAGWEFVTDPPAAIEQVCKAGADGIIAVSGAPVGYIATLASHRDYRLHAEWRWSGKPGNSGALVHISGGPKDRQWPVSFQVQWKSGAVGDVLPMAGATFAEPLTSPPGAATPLVGRKGPDSERPAGEWNVCDIVCRADTIEVTVNGVAQNRVTGLSVVGGRAGFQLEGTPFELRNVTIAALRQ